jgi:hypothetical protein
MHRLIKVLVSKFLKEVKISWTRLRNVILTLNNEETQHLKRKMPGEINNFFQQIINQMHQDQLDLFHQMENQDK